MTMTRQPGSVKHSSTQKLTTAAERKSLLMENIDNFRLGMQACVQTSSFMETGD